MPLSVSCGLAVAIAFRDAEELAGCKASAAILSGLSNWPTYRTATPARGRASALSSHANEAENSDSAGVTVAERCFIGCEAIPCSIDAVASSAAIENSANKKTTMRLCIIGIAGVGYDYVIIDNSPTTDAKTVAAIIASDVFIIPVQLKYFAISGLQEMVMRLEAEGVDKAKMVILRNEWKKFTNYQAAAMAVESMYPENTLKTVIPYDDTLNECVVDGKALLMSKSKAKSAAPFIELVAELFGISIDDVFSVLSKKREEMRKENVKKLQQYWFKPKAIIAGELVNSPVEKEATND